ncbi:MAG TPA: helix-hairpin-helix domain-containing protein [Gammaproteobacteria bacterium]|nr:helix-hairpin-helix domain-containing protein [Gammaproteobacteria bacterium]HKH21445.1 helix-hairpin-helix domain-containing protein [Gammaproteobacteria bacterium]
MSLIRKFSVALLFFMSSICFADPINITSADLEALAALKSIGPANAAAIIADRDANGPFASVEELDRVKGVGEKTIEMNKNTITVSDRRDQAQ